MLQGDDSTAEQYYHDALVAAKKQGNLLQAAKAAGNLGWLKVHSGRYDEATEWLNRGLVLASELQADLVVVRALTNLGWCYGLLGDYDRALFFHSRAETLASLRGYSGERRIALQNIGNVHYWRGDREKAREHYARSLAIAEALRDQAASAELLDNLGVVALDQGRYEDAEVAVREALRINRELQDLPRQQYSRLVEGLIAAARGDYAKAESLYREVLDSPQSDAIIRWTATAALADAAVKSQRPAQAEAEFQKAFALMDESYSELRQAEHRISFLSSLDEFHDDYVDFLVSSGRSERALEVADHSRARQLRERLDVAAASPLSGPASAPITRPFDAVILFYSLAPSRSFLWALTPRGVQFRTLAGEAEIRDHVAAYQRRVVQARDPLAEEDTDADWLYRTLVGPVASSIPPGSRVVLVPDGALFQLNPETLVVSSPKPHYWIEDVTVLTAPSVSLLAARQASRSGSPQHRPEGGSKNAPRPILLIGDPLPAGQEFPRLAQARREIERIADQFTPAERTVLSGPRAVPSAYSRSEPGRFSYIHFAAHARASREVPLDSAVILTAEKDSAKLYAREVVTLPLHARLVTLSACRGAGTRTFAGEGLVGLGWAFLSAGAENVIAGLWNVEDASTSELMANLYRGVRSGQSPAEALREAKLLLLRSDTAYRKPFYWAPFMIYTRALGPGTRRRRSS